MIGDLHNTNFEHDPGELKVAVIIVYRGYLAARHSHVFCTIPV